MNVKTLTEVVQQFLGSVLSGFEVEQLLVLIDELGVDGGVQELMVGQNILEERDVGLEMERHAEKHTFISLPSLNKHFTYEICKRRES